MSQHEQDTQTNPEQIPPSLQFHHIDGGETNLQLESLPPKERLAAEFASWVRGIITKHNSIIPPRGAVGFETEVLEGSYGILDNRAEYRRTGNLNLLEPVTMVFYMNNDIRTGVEFYDLELFMAAGDGNVSEEPILLRSGFDYDVMPAIDGEAPEFIINDVELGLGGISEDEFDSPSDFLAAFRNTFDSARKKFDEQYEFVSPENR